MSSQKVRQRKTGPESWKVDGPRKEICKCCRKELGLFRGNIAMFRGKCLSCQQKICPSCVANNFCHKCSIRHSTKLEPTDLMQLSGKRLLEISSTLHFHNPQGYEKAELVEVILAIYGKKWKRPIPPEPSAGTTTTLLVVGRSEADSEEDSDEGDYRCQKCGKLTRTTASCRHCSALAQLVLEPDSLMQLSGRELHGILEALDVSDDQPREKGELVALILDKCGARRDWQPPIPDPPASRPRSATPDSEASRNGGLPTGQRQNTPFCRSSGHSLANLPESPNDGDQQAPLSAVFSSSSSTTTSSPDSDVGRGTGSSSTTTSPPLGFTPDEAVGPMDWMDGNTPAPSENVDRLPSTDSPAHEDVASDTLSLGSAARTLADQASDAGAEAMPEMVLDQAALDAISSLQDVAEEATIRQLKVHQLKSILHSHGVDFEGCCEKWDLADRVTTLWIADRAEGSNRHDQREDDASHAEEMAEGTSRREPVEDDATQAPTYEGTTPNSASAASTGPRIFLRSDVPNLLDMQSADAIQQLSVPQLKILLQKHSVHYTGCLERSELAGRVSELWNEAKKRESTEDISEDEVCKICMDAFIDCVLLECGHMVSCTECGRQMSECPICRQYVVRVVHTFKV